MLIEVAMVDLPLGAHNVGHFLQQHAVVTLNHSEPLFLGLQLLEVHVEMHVHFRCRVVNASPGSLDLRNSRNGDEHPSSST